MKKRLLILCGMIALLVALGLLPAGATEPTTTQDIDFSAGGTVSAVCPHCKGEAVDWLPLTQEVIDAWGKNYSTANCTHYYVCYTAEDQTKVTLPTSTGLEIGSGEELCVHLNGKQLYRGGARAFAVTGTLNIMDHAAEEGSVVAFANTSSTGMVVRLMTSGAKCNLYGGTLQMKTGSSAYAKSGGCVYCVNGSSFTMYGGTLTGGIAGLGGNLYVENGASTNLLGGAITGGVASGGSNYGGNVYCNGAMTLGNCNITGGTAVLGSDLYFPASGTLVVKNNFAGESYVSLNAAHLPDPLVDGCLTDTTMTSEGAFSGKLYLVKSGEQYELYGKENDTKLYVKEMERADVDFSAGGTVNGYCQHCKTNVDWQPLTKALVDSWFTSGASTINYSTAGGTHYYVSEEAIYFQKPLSIADGESLCLHLNGNEINRGSVGTRAFAVSGNLRLMDHKANEGVVKAYAESTSTGCVIRLGSASAELHMYGGTVKMLTGSHSRAFKGGCVYMAEKSTFYLYGGTIENGKACHGGNVYVEGGCTFEMSGGTLAGGGAMDGTVSGTAYSGYGGNVYMNYTSASGGCTVTITGGTITGGVASDRGGNFYCSSTPNYLNISNATILDGICQTGGGGNLYLNNGYVTITNSTITGGQAQGTSGGNLFIKTGVSETKNYTKLINTTVSGGTAVNYGGNVYSEGKVTIDGNTRIAGGTTGKMGNNMYISSAGKLTVAATYTGEASASFNSSHLSTPIRGGKVSTSAACEGVFTGKLMIENDAQYPTTYGKADDTTLYINAAAVVKNDGTKTWYDANTSAVKAYDSNTKYLVAMGGDLALNGDYTVDLCGANVNITGAGNVTLIDTANKDYATYGSATVSGVTVANEISTVMDGMPYIMMEENGVYAFHCMGVKLTGVSIRPSSSGVYYTGQWNYDEKLATMIDTFGVAVSLAQMPTADFKNDETCLYTGYAASELSSGVQKTGAIIEDILKGTTSAETNNKRGRLPIYAQAYVTLKNNGPVIVGNTGAAESLNSAMTRLDQLIKDDVATSKAYLSNAREFYNTWKEKGMASWELHNIPVQPKVEDGKLNLLMVGNSFCYYYVEELYALLMENLPEGIEEVNIYNVYHSGCTVSAHYNKWLADEAYYTLFKTSAEGRVALTGEYTATLEEALRLEENWDYISLQGTVSSGSNYPKAEEIGMQYAVAEVAEPLLDRFHELFPNAQLLWHRTWPLEEGRRTSTTSASVWTEEYAYNYNIGMQFVCDYMCNEFDLDKPYDLVQVNSGAAWPIVREANAALEESLLPFGGLCARLGLSTYGEYLEGYTGDITHSGDGQHEGDIGGGQLLNAYAWYEALTGNDCRDTEYRPVYTHSGTTYTLSEELVTILQDAAHTIGSAMPETVNPAT